MYVVLTKYGRDRGLSKLVASTWSREAVLFLTSQLGHEVVLIPHKCGRSKTCLSNRPLSPPGGERARADRLPPGHCLENLWTPSDHLGTVPVCACREVQGAEERGQVARLVKLADINVVLHNAVAKIG